jgi:soluble lytic murein transglycosylase-like protein
MAFSEVIARRGLSTPWDDVIREAARGDYEIEALIRAIIATESAWRPDAINPGDPSYGLMQVMPHSAGGAGPPGVTGEQLLDPVVNIRAGAAFVWDLIGRYGRGALSDVIAAYNAGRPRRDASGRYLNQRYVDEVQTYHAWYLTHLPPTTLAPEVEPVPPEGPAPGPPPAGTLLTLGPWLAAALVALVAAVLSLRR